MFRQTPHRDFWTAPTAKALVAFLYIGLSALMLSATTLHTAGLQQTAYESEVTRHSIITTIAGNGIASGSGDGGPALEATLNTPADLAVDAAGNVYVADTFNHRVRMITPEGAITTIAGTGQAGGDGDGGQATEARLRSPLSVAVDADGVLYIADTYNHRIRKVSTDGVITTIAGTGDSGFGGDDEPALDALLSYPTSIAVAADGTLYITDTRNHRVRKLTADGNIATVAGTGASGYSGDGGPATLARLNSPRGVAVAPDGKLYIVDRENRRIRMVDSDGNITTVAGTGSSGYNGDRSQATAATLRAPYGVAVDSDGNFYIADTFNHRIRKVTPEGILTTVAGSERFGFGGDGWPAGQATLHYPLGVAVDIVGNLYVADSFNNRIRKVWTSANNEPTPNLFL
jgi:sugar lactone lactonase YvrE